LLANAWRKRENDAIESCIAAGLGGRLRTDAQMIPTISAATGIINHSKTFIGSSRQSFPVTPRRQD